MTAPAHSSTNEGAGQTQTVPAPLPPPSAVKMANFVCGVNLNCLFDLKSIALHPRNVDYSPKRFPAVVMRLRSPKATGLIFGTGKVQVLGTKSLDDAKLAARKIARALQKMGYQPRLEDFKVQNIVGHADCKALIRLEGLQMDHWQFCRYEPEQFPGLVYTLHEPKVTVLLFAKGKVVLLGAKRREELEEAWAKLYPVFRSFGKTM